MEDGYAGSLLRYWSFDLCNSGMKACPSNVALETVSSTFSRIRNLKSCMIFCIISQASMYWFDLNFHTQQVAAGDVAEMETVKTSLKLMAESLHVQMPDLKWGYCWTSHDETKGTSRTGKATSSEATFANLIWRNGISTSFSADHARSWTYQKAILSTEKKFNKLMQTSNTSFVRQKAFPLSSSVASFIFH